MTAAADIDNRLLADLVGHWAQAKPDEIAIAYGGAEWSWGALHDRVRRAAGGLLDAGIQRGDRVAFLDKNSPATLEVTFAAASIGAAIGILNWRYAGDELDFVINDCGARVLFVGAELLPGLESVRDRIPGVERIIVVGGEEDQYESFLAAAEPAPHQEDVAGDDVALLIYSSGTTGRPKGVMISQQALIAHTTNVGTAFPFVDGDINLVAMPLFHVGGTCYSFFGIAAGVTSIMTREPDAPSLIGALRAGATHAFFVPPVIAGFLAAGDQAIEAMSGLKYLGYGAAPMPLPLLQKALAAWPALNFVQVYGQTELSGVVSTLNPPEHRDLAHPERLLSAGTPVPGAEVRVLDVNTGDALGPGRQGELVFRTTQRMTGYLNRPQDTAETVSSDGWLHTGDIGRVDEAGYIYVEDRLKDMIITGGENVYGPEVERVLMAHPAVVDSAVIGVPDDVWGESVKAVVVTSEPVTAEDVVAFCRERLAGFKCPRTVDFLDVLPRNASGKILKRELRDPYWAGRDRNV